MCVSMRFDNFFFPLFDNDAYTIICFLIIPILCCCRCFSHNFTPLLKSISYQKYLHKYAKYTNINFEICHNYLLKYLCKYAIM